MQAIEWAGSRDNGWSVSWLAKTCAGIPALFPQIRLVADAGPSGCSCFFRRRRSPVSDPGTTRVLGERGRRVWWCFSTGVADESLNQQALALDERGGGRRLEETGEPLQSSSRRSHGAFISAPTVEVRSWSGCGKKDRQQKNVQRIWILFAVLVRESHVWQNYE